MINTARPADVRRERAALLAELHELRADLLRAELESRAALAAVHPSYRASARNLVHYLALRCRDLRPVQERLARHGLSSLGRAEAHVLATIDAVIGTLSDAAGVRAPPPSPAALDFATGGRRLEEHTAALLGPEPPSRRVRIMVTMPSEAARDAALVHELVQAGMDCMRINCAHDDVELWERMIDHLRRAEAATGRSCRLLMDLGGAKIRTGPITTGPAVVKVKPVRDALGRVVRPARIWLAAVRNGATAAPPGPTDAQVPVPAEWLGGLLVADRLRFVDARGARRVWLVTATTAEGCWAECTRTAYVVPGLRLRRPDGVATLVGELPPTEGVITLHIDDLLVLTRSQAPGRPAQCDAEGRLLAPATVSCTAPAVVDALRPGERVWIDDGKIGAVVERVDEAGAHLRVTHGRAAGVKVRGDKGINVPDTALPRPALTDRDLAHFDFVARHADMVALSFVNSADDVLLLERRLGSYHDRRPAIVLKIETRRAFEQLPAILLAAMHASNCGVMVARGDLAVECGFERLAEVQEEILWVCEAAHVPAIWATQVLETLAKEGLPSRAEITDAAMGDRAECVMLNKGPHVVQAVQALDDILRRMQGHLSKKSSMLRELRLAHGFLGTRRTSSGDARYAGPAATRQDFKPSPTFRSIPVP